MAKYRVTVPVYAEVVIEVEEPDKQAALSIATERAVEPPLCFSCTNKIRVYDVNEEVMEILDTDLVEEISNNKPHGL